MQRTSRDLFVFCVVILLAAASAAIAWKVAVWQCDLGIGLPLRSCAWPDAQRSASMDPDAVRARLVTAPLDGSGYRRLAQMEATGGDRAQMGRLYQIAARRAPRDLVARHWHYQQAAAAGRAEAAAGALDALLRLDEVAAPALLAGSMPYLANPAFRSTLAARLAVDPRWRALLPATLLASDTPLHAEALMSAIADRGTVTAAETAAHVQLLERLGRPVQARWRWSRALPPASRRLDGNVFDGGFEGGAGPAPYGWTFDSQGGAVAGLDDSTQWEGMTSLAIAFGGRAVDFMGVSQDLVLRPGQYRLSLHADIDLSGVRPLQWTVQCRPSGRPIAHLQLAAANDGWKEFAAVFIVPPECATQRLLMTSQGRNLAERQVAGEVHVDGLAIVRLPGADGIR